MKTNHTFTLKFSFVAECVYILLITAIAIHFLTERIACKNMPHGDEGSWMSVASELSKGNGYTTRWLEFSFLKPYDVPRPDDYRYPGLVGLLALCFKLFGTTYAVAHSLTGVLFILFGFFVYAVVKKKHGVRTACATLPLVYFSLLQLMYNSEVYTEGLFGIGLAFMLLISCRHSPRSHAWWPLTGCAIGLLYLVRPNAILFSCVFVCYALLSLYRYRSMRRPVITGVLIMTAIMLPWLIRSWVLFGNPFHLAGSAGLLCKSVHDPQPLSFSEFIRTNGTVYFVKSSFFNIHSFFSLLHNQEHGLELIPLFGCITGIIRRKVFFNTPIALGFALSLFACTYTSAYGSWAGVRYFSPFLPFVYAYGIFQIFEIGDAALRKFSPFTQRVAKPVFAAILICILCAPVFYPQRYYERFYACAMRMPHGSTNYAAYYTALKSRCAAHPFYYAGALAQINFGTDLNCVGIQGIYTAADIRKSQQAFHPALMALLPQEFANPDFTELMNTLKNDGNQLTPYWMPDSSVVFVQINTPP